MSLKKERISWVKASKRLESKRPGVQSLSVQSRSVLVSRVQAPRQCVQSPALLLFQEKTFSSITCASITCARIVLESTLRPCQRSMIQLL